MEKLDFLIDYLLTENKEIKVEKMPTNIEDKKNLWRSLCNIRNAKQISSKYLQIEKEYLQEELKNKSITKVGDINSISDSIKESNLQNKNLTQHSNQRLQLGTPEPCYIHNKDTICLWKGDITLLEIDSIVNAANSGGVRLFYSLP